MLVRVWIGGESKEERGRQRQRVVQADGKRYVRGNETEGDNWSSGDALRRWRVSYRGLGDLTLFSGLTLPHLDSLPQPPATSPRSTAFYLLLPFLPLLPLQPLSTPNARHGTLPGVLRCCLPRHPDVQFCITIRRALRKLPRNFSFPSR